MSVGDAAEVRIVSDDDMTDCEICDVAVATDDDEKPYVAVVFNS